MIRRNGLRQVVIATAVTMAVVCNFAYFYLNQHSPQSVTQTTVFIPTVVVSSAAVEDKTLPAKSPTCSATKPTLTSSGQLPGDQQPVRVARGSPMTLGARVSQMKSGGISLSEGNTSGDRTARKVECSVPCLYVSSKWASVLDYCFEKVRAYICVFDPSTICHHCKGG